MRARPAAVEELTAAELDQRCLDAALHYLASRPRSEAEIRRRLLEKRHEPDRVERVLERLRQLKLADDRAFADYWLENRQLHKPRGARALRAELFQKGVARDVVEGALDPERDEAAEAYRAGLKRARQLTTLDEPAFRQRLSPFLQRRGFDWAAVESAVDRLWSDRTTCYDPPESIEST